MHRQFLASLLILATLSLAPAHASKLRAGPMLGYSEMREVAIWVQTQTSAEAKIRYWPKSAPQNKAESEVITTKIENAFTATLKARNLTPGESYLYEVYLDGKKQPLDYTAEFQTIPFYRDRMPPPDVSIAFGGTNYVLDKTYDPLNRTPGGDYSIYLAVLAKKPNMMVWVGNSIFLRESDWGSYSGYLSRYTRNRSKAELQPLLASIHHSAVWSQHDYGGPGEDAYKWNKQHAQDAFERFWPNPSFGAGDLAGTMTQLRCSDVDLFLLDDRTHRDFTSKLEKKHTILGEKQVTWLINALEQSRATFKLVVLGSPMLNPADSEENMVRAKYEHDQLLNKIKEKKIGSVIFVSGGKMHGELTKMVRSGAPDIYDLTIGPLTGRPEKDTKELNYFRVPGTSTFQRHFVIMDVTGPEDNRELKMTAYDPLGEEIWAEQFTSNQLEFIKK